MEITSFVAGVTSSPRVIQIGSWPRGAEIVGLDLAIPALEPEILTLPMDRRRMFLRGMSWLVPQDFLRKAILTGPIGVFRKGAYVVTSINPRALAAEITPKASRISTKAGGEVRVAAPAQPHGDGLAQSKRS